MTLVPHKYILLYAWFLHLAWAILLLIDPVGLHTAPLAALGLFTQDSGHLTSAILFFSCACAVPGFIHSTKFWSRPCFMPQQLLLLISATHSLTLILAGSYADGVVRPSLFILADQLPNLVATVMHTLALHRVP